MGEAIGQILPLAVGVALSPIPIIAVVLILVTERARSNGPAFVAGWIVGLALVGVLVFAIAGGAGATDEGGPATWVSALELVLGLLLLFVALRQWRGRPGEGDEPKTPKWMRSIDAFTPAKAFGMAAVLSGLNPKNLLLSVAAAAAIAETGISTGDDVIAYVVFVVLASAGVVVPVALYFALGERSRQPLDRLHGWMGRNNAAIMAVLCLIIGVKLVGDAISGFSS